MARIAGGLATTTDQTIPTGPDPILAMNDVLTTHTAIEVQARHLAVVSVVESLTIDVAELATDTVGLEQRAADQAGVLICSGRPFAGSYWPSMIPDQLRMPSAVPFA